MNKYISTVDKIDWFKTCVGCADFPAMVDPALKECRTCKRCPYAICGSHEDKYRKS